MIAAQEASTLSLDELNFNWVCCEIRTCMFRTCGNECVGIVRWRRNWVALKEVKSGC